MTFLFADSNRARIRYIKEADNSWGTPPSSGITRELRFTGSTLNVQKETAISNEIRADRMVEDVIETGMKSSGDFNIEFSAGSHDDLMEGFFYGAWTRPMTFDGVKGITLAWISTSELVINGKDWSLYFTPGRRLRTDGFVNPSNNNYWAISTVTWNSGANRTEIVMTETTAVIEAGSAYSVLWDANDVIVLRDTHIRSGTSGASTFDSNSNNSFAAGIAAGQIVSGQKIFVEGLGYERGTVTVADPGSALVAAGATITVFDDKNTVTFQFGGSPVPGNIMVVASVSDDTVTAANLALAINQQRPSGKLNVSALAASNVVTIKNLNQTGGNITKAGDTNTAFAIGAFSGGDLTVRGIYTLTAVADDTLTVSPAPDTINNSTREITIKGSMLRNPSDPTHIIPHSFSVEVDFEDIGRYRIADGQRVSTMAYTITAGSILTGQYGVMGAEIKKLLASKLGNTGNYSVLGTTSTAVANATVNVGTIFMNGVALTTALKSISFNANNSLRDQTAVSYKFPAGIGAGRIEITGAAEAYFANDDMWDQFIAHDTVSLNWGLTDVDNHHYEFTVPACVFTTDTENPAGGNQDIMETLDWTAKRDPVTQCMFQIDRFSDISPLAA